MTKLYPKEFRDDVVRVARNREPGVGLEQIAKFVGGRGVEFMPGPALVVANLYAMTAGREHADRRP
ncbi:hypothetical protein OCAE111667_21160 [Occultella aeris]|uniref:Transposase n=1 Tax=Occultella aeris TaxID=2761496 RepID=A0A7M4DQS0_9MICO|nr:hypothetical protein [Occultella aeris]VZO39814.1 hypothetical protein HALOF300_04511 [Occultella aeris]